MSIDALASRFDSSVAKSLYSDDSVVGGAPPFIDCGHDPQAEHPGDLGLGDELGDALAHDRVVPQRLGRRASRCATYSHSRSRRCWMGENVNIVKRSRSSASEMYWNPLLSSPTT